MSCEEKNIRHVNARAISDLEKLVAALRSELEKLRVAFIQENDRIEQSLGKALGYPWYKDDQANFPGATEKEGVYVGKHTAATLAREAAAELEKLRAEARWIPVEERLPGDNTPVLVFHRKLKERVGELRWERPGYEDCFKPHRYWDDPYDVGRDWEWGDITHWRALSFAPEEKEGR